MARDPNLSQLPTRFNDNREGKHDLLLMNDTALTNTAKFSSRCAWKWYVGILEAAIYI